MQRVSGLASDPFSVPFDDCFAQQNSTACKGSAAEHF
jgi:hypothetical protein